MKFRFIVLFINCLLGVWMVGGLTAVLANADNRTQMNVEVTDERRLSATPFVQNVGQFDSAVLYQLRDAQAIYWFTSDSVWVSAYDPATHEGIHLQWVFPGANPQPQIEPFGRLDNMVSYYGDPDHPLPAVPVWEGIRYVNLYEGIDLELRVENGRLQPHLLVKDTAKLADVQLQVNGAEQLQLLDGLYEVKTAVGTWTFPLFTINDLRLTIENTPHPYVTGNHITSPFSLHSAGNQRLHSIQHSAFNTTTLFYSTLLGGTFPDEGHSLVTDAAGHAYITGRTESPSFPTDTIPFNGSHGIDVYIARFVPDGTAADYIIWINATNALYEDYGYAIAINNQGEAFVTGETRSPEFCLFFGNLPGYDTTYNENNDAFALKVSADGSQMDYCTFLGGDDWDTGRAIGVDAVNNAYIVGGSWSTNLPTTTNSYDGSPNGLRDSYLMKLDPTGTQLLYSTYLGGAGQEEVRDIVVEGNGRVHLAGWTNSDDFPTTNNAYEPDYQGNFDAFLFTFDAAGQREYATYLGGSNEDRALTLAISSDNDTYVQGYTLSTDFYTTTATFDPTHNGGYDAYLLKLNPTRDEITFSTYLGGGGDDRGYGMAIDAVGAAYVTGETTSTDFPTTTLAYDSSLTGGVDAFIAQLSADGGQLLYSSYLGGDSTDRGNAISANNCGEAFVTGTTVSTDFPVTAGAYDTTPNGDYDAFVTKLPVAVTAELLASFMGTPIDGLSPLSVTFTNTSECGYENSLWDFGDGYTSTLTNPVHLYTAPGSYTVTLTISNTTDVDTEVKIGYINVFDHKPLQASFIATPTLGTSPLVVTFTNTSTGGYQSSLWDFGDGYTSTLTNPVHLYTATDSYTVTLTISNTTDIDTETKIGYITVSPYRLYLPVALNN